MINKKLFFLNILFFTMAAYLLLGLQTSLWLQVFGYFPAPQTWISLFVFLILYRSLSEAFLMVYLLSFVNNAFTSMPYSYFLFSNILLGLAILAFKHRIFRPGSIYFSLVCCGSVFLFGIIHFFTYTLFSGQLANSFPFYEWSVSSLLTGLFSFPLYGIFEILDRVTQKVRPAETGASHL